VDRRGRANSQTSRNKHTNTEQTIERIHAKRAGRDELARPRLPETKEGLFAAREATEPSADLET